MNQEIQDLLIGVLTLLVGYLVWQVQRVQSRFDSLIADDHVHREEFNVTVTRLYALSDQLNRPRGEFEAHMRGENK